MLSTISLQGLMNKMFSLMAISGLLLAVWGLMVTPEETSNSAIGLTLRGDNAAWLTPLRGYSAPPISNDTIALGH
jgi:hypothetical protein